MKSIILALVLSFLYVAPSLAQPCAIAGPGAASSYLPLLLLLPALILIRRLWRRR